MNKVCSRCKQEFECKEEQSCWCFEEPGIRQDEIEYDDCVCKACLQIQYRKRLVGE